MDGYTTWIKLYILKPTHTYATSSVCGYKQAKDRLTVSVFANADGSHTYGMYIVGKAKRPRTFSKIWCPRQLGVTWTSNNTAWMNKVAFTDFLLEFDQDMHRRYKGDEVLLLLHNDLVISLRRVLC